MYMTIPEAAGSAVKNLSFRAWRGQPYPLGATWDGNGVNFAFFSEHASAVELCLFDDQDTRRQIARIPVEERTDLVWHVYIPGLKHGQLYGYRVDGPYEPKKGHRFNPAKLILDPYGKSISGTIQWDDALYGYRVGIRMQIYRRMAETARRSCLKALSLIRASIGKEMLHLEHPGTKPLFMKRTSKA